MTSAAPPDLSVVIPVYRSAGTVPELLGRLRRTLETSGSTWEVVLVEDGSPDGSWETLTRELASDPRGVVAVRLTRNFGQHNALMCGFRTASGRVVVTMDDDLQNPPEEIPALVGRLDEGSFDVVYGRYPGKEHAPWRNLGSWLVNAFYRRAFGTGVTVTSFRAIRREILESVLRYDLNYTFVDGLLAWTTDRIGDVPVSHHPRPSGRSGYSLARLATLALNLLTNFSLVPLQLVTGLGLLLAGGGFLVGAFSLLQYLQHRILVPGYASTITAILVLGGAQLVALGVIGEYVGRLHLNVNRKPQYVVRTVLGAGSSPGDGGAPADPALEAPVRPTPAPPPARPARA